MAVKKYEKLGIDYRLKDMKPMNRERLQELKKLTYMCK